MASESRHLSVPVDRPPAEVYDYIVHPPHLNEWAAGLTTKIEQIDGRWYVGPGTELTFAPRNDLGVADHDVTAPDGEVVHNPLRVLPDGDGSEVVFTVRRRAGMTDAEYDADVAAVQADLEALKRILE
jgi:uncharacterized protein YndB with AHSA1/START domain